MTDVYISPEIGVRMGRQREWLGMSPDVAASGMRRLGQDSFQSGDDVLEFEHGGFVSYLSVLAAFSRLYRCSVDAFFNDQSWRTRPLPPHLAEAIERLSDGDAEMVGRFHDFLHRAGPAPEVGRG